VQDYGQYLRDLSRRLRDAREIARTEHNLDGLAITAITFGAIGWFQSHWEQHPHRRTSWDWAGDDHRPETGWNAAIWLGETLCGLASGQLTRNAVRLDYIERFPGENPLKGRTIPIALTVIDAYAGLTDRTELRINDVESRLIPIYERFGFELAPERGRVHVMVRKRK
jgi:hypothetical protein